MLLFLPNLVKNKRQVYRESNTATPLEWLLEFQLQ